MSCKYILNNQTFNSKEELKEYFSQRKNITKDIIATFGGNTSTTITPYKGTDMWVGVAFRRILKLAVDEGYSGVALATGQQSADMYSLSQQVDKIDITPQGDVKAVYISMKNNADDTVFINQEGVITESASGAYNGKKAEEVLGKDLTRKILETEEETTLEGEGLEFGGEGMKAFYDKIVPKVVQKEAQRFDKNAKLETVDFKIDQSIKAEPQYDIDGNIVRWKASKEGEDLIAVAQTEQEAIEKYKEMFPSLVNDKLSLGVQPYLPLTNAIKESVSQGIPQFQKALSQQGINLIPNGFALKNGQIYLNTDTMTPDLVMHEFQHLLLNWAKEARPDIYNRGLELARKELEKGKTVDESRSNKNKIDFSSKKSIIKWMNQEAPESLFDDEGELDFDNFVNQDGDNINDLIDWYTSKYNEVKKEGGAVIYRAVKADNVSQIDFKNTGEFWSFEEDGAYSYGTGGVRDTEGDNLFTIEAYVKFEDINWEQGFYSFLTYGRNEFESFLYYDAEVDVYEVKDLKGNILLEDFKATIRLDKLPTDKKSEIQDVIDYIRTTQPNLTGEALENEVITEFVGRYSKQMMDEQKAKSPLMQFLQDFWESVKQMLGITEMTPAQVANLTLEEYAKASVVTLSNGENFVGDNGEANFNRWKGENELVVGSEIQNVKTGQPIIVKGYHGTTNEFYEFDASVKGSIEGHLGKVNYFTSDYQDATQNYLSDGADITGRIENYKESVLSTLEIEVDETLEDEELEERIREVVSENYSNFDNSSLDYGMSLSEVADRIASTELLGGEEIILDVFIKLNNPVVLGNGATWFETLDIDEVYMQEATEEIAEEYGITEDEAKEEYEYEIRDRAVEKQGDGNKIVSALEQALDDNGYDQAQVFDILGDNYYETEVDLNRLEESIRKSELYDNYNGELASSQVIADFFKNLGFDGIILTDVSQRFSGMRLSPSTSHIHVFDEYNNQIKLADGSNTTFNPKTSDIRFQKIVYDARVETRAEMFQMINNYGIVINNLYPKSKENEIKDKFDECRI